MRWSKGASGGGLKSERKMRTTDNTDLKKGKNTVKRATHGGRELSP